MSNLDPEGMPQDPGDQIINSESERMDVVNIDRHNVIVDGLLCSIMKALSRSNKDGDLAAAVVRDKSEHEITEAWKKLFSFFNDVKDENRVIPIITIKRQTVRLMVDDIIRLFRKKDLTSDFSMLVFPWYYTIDPFMTDQEETGQVWRNETVVETSKRLDSLEAKLGAEIEKKHQDLIANLQRWSESVAKAFQPNSYAAVASANQALSFFNSNCTSNLQPPRTTFPWQSAPSSGLNSRRSPSVSSTNDFRNRLNSNGGGGTKRARTEPQLDDNQKRLRKL